MTAERKSFGSIKLSWQWTEEYRTWMARIPAVDFQGSGFFLIYAVERASYCDRGKWHVLVDNIGVGPLDDQEGFPRYYFDLENLKHEMECWANCREECRKANGLQ